MAHEGTENASLRLMVRSFCTLIAATHAWQRVSPQMPHRVELDTSAPPQGAAMDSAARAVADAPTHRTDLTAPPDADRAHVPPVRCHRLVLQLEQGAPDTVTQRNATQRPLNSSGRAEEQGNAMVKEKGLDVSL